MSTRRSHDYIQAVLVGVLLYVVSGVFSISHPQVVTNIASDSTLGSVVTGPAVIDANGANVYSINQGTINGVNQFHSLQHLSVGLPAGALPGALPDIASFDGPAGIQNILTRVTGGEISQIDGVLRSTIDGANLFLMNPRGMMFGPNGQLDLSGSFHATTADRIRFDDVNATLFNAVASGADASLDPLDNPLLATAMPAAFGFVSADPASIDVRGELTGVELTALAVSAGQTLSLVGGTLNLGAAEVRDVNGQISQDAMPANLAAPGGRVNLVSVASAGEAVFDGTGFNVDGFAQLGDINITGGDIRAFGSEFLFANVVDGKDVFIRGGRLVMDDGLISPGVSSVFTPSPDGGEVDIRVTGDVTITGTDVDFLSNVVPGIFTQAGSFFTPELLPDAKVPDITIEAGGSLTLSGAASVKTDRLGPGAAADVVINADTVTVKDGASIVSLNFFEGPGSNITINARQVELSGDGTVSPTGITGLSAQNLVHPAAQNLVFPCCDDVPPRLTFADAGSITVNATETVSVSGDALILADSLGLGRGGDITIDTGDLAIIGVGAETAAIKGQSAFAGDAGDITIDASGTIELRDGGQIAGTTVGAGEGSTVTVTADGAITFTGADSRIVNATAPLPIDELNELFEFTFGKSFETLRDELGLAADADIFDVLGGLTGVPDLAAGDAGTLSISTPVLTLNADTRMEMSTGWEGDAGVVQANVGSLSLNNGGAINSRSGIERLTGEVIVGTGDAGAVNITATDTISISGAGSIISTSTLGDGDGGAIDLTSAGQVVIGNGGSVTADSEGTGLTGDINITAGTDIVMDGGTVSTQAVTSDGGNIKLTAPNIVRLDDSQVTTSVESGVGGGGNINIDPRFVLLDNSQVTANAFGGPGGNILIVADQFLATPDSVVQASSAQSIQGTVQIDAPDTDIAAAIAQLPESFLDASALLPARCAARSGGSESSFVVAGRGGVPNDPDGYLPSSVVHGLADVEGTAAPAVADSVALNDVKKLILATAGRGCAW